MHIVVPVKQVPETDNVKMDSESGTMIRKGLSAIINPLDLYAIETALQLKEAHGGKITAISMGPPLAEKALREAMALGCDDALLLSHRKFAGSDTWATAYTLAQAIKKLDDVDLVICGERATDGDTGQVGPGIAAFLDLPLATYVSRVFDVKDRCLRVERLVEGGTQTLWSFLPAVLTVIKEIGNPRYPTLDSKLRAKWANVSVWGPDDFDVKLENLGLKGSPTRVVKIDTPKVAREGEVISVTTPADVDHAATRIFDFLRTRHFI